MAEGREVQWPLGDGRSPAQAAEAAEALVGQYRDITLSAPPPPQQARPPVSGLVHAIDPESGNLFVVVGPNPSHPSCRLVLLPAAGITSVRPPRETPADLDLEVLCRHSAAVAALGVSSASLGGGKAVGGGQTDAPAPSPEETARRRGVLTAKLTASGLPFTVDVSSGAVELLGGAASVRAPYGPNDCSSGNEIVLEKVQAILATCT